MNFIIFETKFNEYIINEEKNKINIYFFIMRLNIFLSQKIKQLIEKLQIICHSYNDKVYLLLFFFEKTTMLITCNLF